VSQVSNHIHVVVLSCSSSVCRGNLNRSVLFAKSLFRSGTMFIGRELANGVFFLFVGLRTLLLVLLFFVLCDGLFLMFSDGHIFFSLFLLDLSRGRDGFLLTFFRIFKPLSRHLRLKSFSYLIDKRLLHINDRLLFFSDLYFLLCSVFTFRILLLRFYDIDFLAHFEEGNLFSVIVSATIVPVASVLPILVFRAPLRRRIQSNLVSLLFYSLVKVEVDLTWNKLGLGNVPCLLGRHEILILLNCGSRCICGNLTGVVLCANLSHFWIAFSLGFKCLFL